MVGVLALLSGVVGWVLSLYIAMSLGLLWSKPARRWFGPVIDSGPPVMALDGSPPPQERRASCPSAAAAHGSATGWRLPPPAGAHRRRPPPGWRPHRLRRRAGDHRLGHRPVGGRCHRGAATSRRRRLAAGNHHRPRRTTAATARHRPTEYSAGHIAPDQRSHVSTARTTRPTQASPTLPPEQGGGARNGPRTSSVDASTLSSIRRGSSDRRQCWIGCVMAWIGCARLLYEAFNLFRGRRELVRHRPGLDRQADRHRRRMARTGSGSSASAGSC